MKLALIQPNPVEGRIEENVLRLKRLCEEALSKGASLCFAPAEALAGPIALDSREKADLTASCLKAGQRLAPMFGPGQGLICALPSKRPIAVMDGGVRPALRLEFGGLVIECQDKSPLHRANSRPHRNPPDILAFLEARPFHPEGQDRAEAAAASQAQRRNTLILALNLAGGCGQTVYAGQSFAAFPGSGIAARACAFSEAALVFEMGKPGQLAPRLSGDEAQWDALVCGTRDFIRKAGANKVVIGLSGGMDSAFVACVAAEAIGGNNIIGVMMPSPFSSAGSIEDSRQLAANLGIETRIVPIKPMMDAFTGALVSAFEAITPQRRDLTLENLQARIRGVILMAFANRSGGLVLNTGNKSEISMGYCTLYGDAVGALAVIGDLYKTRVYELGFWLNRRGRKEIIPKEILEKEPSAELAPNQKDTDSLPPYSELDLILAALEKGLLRKDKTSAEKWVGIKARVEANAFKRRQMPPALLVG